MILNGVIISKNIQALREIWIRVILTRLRTQMDRCGLIRIMQIETFLWFHFEYHGNNYGYPVLEWASLTFVSFNKYRSSTFLTRYACPVHSCVEGTSDNLMRVGVWINDQWRERRMVLWRSEVWNGYKCDDVRATGPQKDFLWTKHSHKNLI